MLAREGGLIRVHKSYSPSPQGRLPMGEFAFLAFFLPSDEFVNSQTNKDVYSLAQEAATTGREGRLHVIALIAHTIE